MTCREFRRKHDAYIDDTLSGADLDRMARHCRLCEECAHLDTRVRRALLIARNVPIIHPSPDFNQRLQARLNVERTRQRALLDEGTAVDQQRAGSLSMGVYTVIAAGIIVVAGLGGALTLAGTRDNAIRMAPVASRAPLDSPTVIAAIPPSEVPLWPAEFTPQEAPWHFASDAMSGR